LPVACTRQDTGSTNKTVLRVGERELTLGQFRNELNKRVSQLDPLLVQTPKQLDSLKNEISEAFVVQSLVESFAKETGLVVKKEALDEEVKNTIKGYPDELTFERSLSEEGLTFADWQSALKKTLLQKLVLKNITKVPPKITEQEKQAYYQANIERFKEPERAELRQIVLDTEASAKKVEADWRGGKALADLAKKFSITPDGKNGGYVGWVERGAFEAFDQMFDKPIGYKSSLIKSAYGYHLIELKNKRAARTISLSEVSASIEASLRQEKEQIAYTQWLEEQLRKAKIFKDEELIRRRKR